jgi:hypothetical protein
MALLFKKVILYIRVYIRALIKGGENLRMHMANLDLILSLTCINVVLIS